MSASARGTEDPPLQPILTLTEEEVLVLTGGDLGVVPRRMVDGSSRAVAHAVDVAVTRGLMARGLLLPVQDATVAGSVSTTPLPEAGWEAAEPVGLTMTLRAAAPAVLVVQRVLGPRLDPLTADGPNVDGLNADGPNADRSTVDHQAWAGTPPPSTVQTRYLHLHDQVAVIEDVTPDRMHSFLTVFPDRFADAIADFILPPDALAGLGPARRLGASGSVDALLAELGRPTALVEAAAVARTGPTRGLGPPRLMLALGPGGTFLSTDSVTYHPVDPHDAVTELLRMALGGPEPEPR